MLPGMKIDSPDDPTLEELCRQLARRADDTDLSGAWPAEQLTLCGQYGVFRWFVPVEQGGQGWSDADVIRGYLRLSAACLTTTFVITQRTGACRRILASGNREAISRHLPDLISGRSFATVGISHLTTSRRHLARPVMTAQETASGLILDGFSPWVTGGDHAETIVTGATLEDGRQILVALPTATPGVEVAEPAKLVALSSSHTGAVHCRNVAIGRQALLAGPVENVMSQGVGARTGGVETSTLAAGLAAAALDYLRGQAIQRPELALAASGFAREHEDLVRDLLNYASGVADCTTDEIRARANSLVLRVTQAALMAAKGTGFVTGHPAGRWCREALFFLVWSCPQPVLAANLCQWASLGD
jgi:alkylation response protein AidB-like acyl-CoA dehydrogenase